MDLRGNVETRLAAARGGKLDAVVLAEAGLNRLGLSSHVTERLGPPHFLPAPGQGALGIECRSDDAATRALLAPLDDPATHRAILAERRVLFELEGGCTIPLAAWAQEGSTFGRDDAPRLWLHAALFMTNGPGKIAVCMPGPLDEPEELGRRVAERLRQAGAEDYLSGRDVPTS